MIKLFKKNLKIITPKKIIELRRFHIYKHPYYNYNIKYKCIFIHIPKTAGTSILSTLAGRIRGRNHSDFSCYEKFNPSAFTEYYKFTFVRNPWGRVVSCYEYLLNGGNQQEDLYYKKLLIEKYNTFEKFVLEFLNHEVIHENVLFKPQYLFIYDHTGKCKVNFIGRFENIFNDSKEILNKLNIKSELPETNASMRKPYQEYYRNNKVKNKISNLYKKDIELFNYNF